MKDPRERLKQVLETRFGSFVQMMLRPLDRHAIEVGLIFLEWVPPMTLQPMRCEELIRESPKQEPILQGPGE